MASYRYIDDFSIGDTYKVIRSLDTVPDDLTISDAWWTVKAKVTDTDANALLSIHINEYTAVSGIGEVSNYADGSARLQFIATPEASADMSQDKTYFYDIHVNLSSGEKYMLEFGKLFTGMHVTHSH